MSSPESERELLLNASLDGELNAEEQAKLEQWLREDPGFAKRRESFSQQRTLLRQALAGDRGKKLDRGFADRVVHAAIAQAQAEGLDRSHPLIRLAKSGSSDTWAADTVSARRWWRQAGTAAALAASLLVVVFVARRSSEGPQGSATILEIAQHEMAETAAVDRIASSGSRGAGGDLDPPLIPDPSAVAANRSAVSPEPMSPEPRNEGASRTIDASARVSDPIALSPRAPSPNSGGAVPGRVKPAAANPLKAVMVVSIEVTPEGKASLALVEALRAEKIRIAADGMLPAEVINQLTSDGMIRLSQDGEGGKLYFVQASTLQLDRFVTRLLADQQSFASFSLGIATDAQVLASVNSLAIEPLAPDAVAGESAAEGEDRPDGSGAFARDLISPTGQPLRVEQGKAFAPLDRGTGLADLLTPLQPQSPPADDVRSQLLLLVR